MIVLDTNVLSELMRAKPAARVVTWIGRWPVSELFTTSITEAEIFYGIELLPSSKHRHALLAAAEAMFVEDFRGRILSFNGVAARAFSRIAAHRRSLGMPISQADAQIAAIVQAQRGTLATRNVADFRDCGINVVDPWNDPLA